MTFLTTSLIAGGLAAAVVPVVLHLVMQGRPKAYEFPALRFIRLRLAANQRRFRLKHLLLLALRVLLLVLLGVSLARPTLRWIGDYGVTALPFGSQESPVAAVIIIDTSPRMGYIAANQTRLTEAQEHALWLLEQFPKDSRVAVLGSQRVPASFQVDLLAARERIERLSTVMTGRSLLDSLTEGARLLKQTELERRDSPVLRPNEIYLITDMTEPGWPEALSPSVRAALENVPDATLHLIDVGITPASDTALTRVTLSDEVLSAEMPLRIEVELSHTGEAESRTAELFLGTRDEGRGTRDEESETPIPYPLSPIPSLLKRDTKTVDFPAGTSRRNIVFELSVLSEGTNQGVIRLTSPDALAANDEISFTVEVRPPSRVLIVAPPNVQSLFLREALAPERLRLNGIIPYRIDTLSVDQFNESQPNQLTDYRAVFLLDPKPMPPASWKKLADHAAAGNGVAVFLGRNATPISEFNEGTARELLGVTLRMQVPKPDGDLWLTVPSYENPVLRPFREMAQSDTMGIPWHAVPIFRYWHVDNLAAGTDVVMQYSDYCAGGTDHPAMVTRTLGQGNVLVATTPVSDLPDENAWNLLPTSMEAPWLFVMLSDGITQFLLGIGERHYNYLAGQLVTLRPDVLPASCIVKPPQGEGVRITPDSLRQAITFPATEQLGNYTVSSGGSGGTSRLQTGFSVNAPAQTWNLARITPEQAQAVCGNRLRVTRDRSTLESGMSQSRTGSELFPLVMLLVLTVFVAEYFVSNRFYGEEISQKK